MNALDRLAVRAQFRMGKAEATLPADWLRDKWTEWRFRRQLRHLEPTVAIWETLLGMNDEEEYED